MLKSRHVIGGAEIDSKVRSLRRCRLIDCRCGLRGIVVSVKPVSGGDGSLKRCQPFVEYRDEQNGGGLRRYGLDRVGDTAELAPRCDELAPVAVSIHFSLFGVGLCDDLVETMFSRSFSARPLDTG